jgi:hypothetical protein
MNQTELAQAVQAFARVTVGLTTLDEEWPRLEPDSIWRGYSDTRDVFFRVYQQLRDLASHIIQQRNADGPQITTAQRILAQHQIAYRDLYGALVGVSSDEFDRQPAPEEWQLRAVLAHIMRTERGFLSRIVYALQNNAEPLTEMPEEQLIRFGRREADPIGSMGEILARFDALHDRVLAELGPLGDEQLATPSLWWEGYPVEIRFRMHRFDSHLREHTIQVDKTLEGIGHKLGEPERLLRLIYQALGEVEGAMIGLPDHVQTRQAAVDIHALAADVQPAQAAAATEEELSS